jgi:2-oxoglutarate ferredoxin oxidoreductase subunit alpha
VATKPVKAFVNHIDLLVALDKGAVEHLEKRITADTVIVAEAKFLPKGFSHSVERIIDVSFSNLVADIGGKLYSNSIAVGMVTSLFGIDLQIVEEQLKQFFGKKGQDIIDKNLSAVQKGYEFGNGKISIDIKPAGRSKEQIVLNGAQAVTLGAIAGGCNFISAYPMSPSTAVLVFLAQHSKQFGIVAEQAEDEIAAINMAIGAWYAGARAIITTSGGGFALMTEGISLASMLETPVVVHLAQRPGPATGLPTRTEQGDLELALYAGHGEFPRILFAPGTLQEAFQLTAKAFNLADKHQVPVIILTDQYFVDSHYNIEPFNTGDTKVEKFITETKENYTRYELTADGISPRGIPGFGRGLVTVDSDEHNTEGHITEDLDLRVKMVDKRLAKLDAIKSEAVKPRLWPDENYKNLILCWGSTYHIVKEAIDTIGRNDTSLLHFSQVYPLHESTKQYLEKAETIAIFESNATGQLAKLIKLQTGFEIENKILKYSGLSFAVEEVINSLKDLLG